MLQFAGEHYGVPLDLYRHLLGRFGGGEVGERAARRRLAAMEAAGLARRVPAGGGVWCTPTRAGLRRMGLPYAPWDPADRDELAHVAAVARLRLALIEAHPNATAWQSERSFRHTWQGSGARVRIPDGALVLGDGRVCGVELERHRKSRRRYGPIVEDVDPSLDEVWWFTPDPGWLHGVLAGLVVARRPKHTVMPIPAGVLG